jgi:hypothetical protein
VVGGSPISRFAQYAHLDELEQIVDQYPETRIALGGDYVVTPDILVEVEPFTDAQLQGSGSPLGKDTAKLSALRSEVLPSAFPLLHASISCKWTMRRDRAQNTRLEALNLVRNRNGRLPHVVAVTMEPTAGTLGSLARGTGDIDCVYHGALYELLDEADALANAHGGAWVRAADSLHEMTDGRRLRDISDLPLDLLL